MQVVYVSTLHTESPGFHERDGDAEGTTHPVFAWASRPGRQKESYCSIAQDCLVLY